MSHSIAIARGHGNGYAKAVLYIEEEKGYCRSVLQMSHS